MIFYTAFVMALWYVWLFKETENNNVWTSFINLFQGNCVKLPLPVVNSHPSKLRSFIVIMSLKRYSQRVVGEYTIVSTQIGLYLQTKLNYTRYYYILVMHNYNFVKLHLSEVNFDKLCFLYSP